MNAHSLGKGLIRSDLRREISQSLSVQVLVMEVMELLVMNKKFL